MKHIINDQSGLVQIAHPSGLWAIGWKENKSTACLGEFKSDGLADMFDENEWAVVRFIEGYPHQLISFSNKQAEEHELQDNEVKIKFGCFFVIPYHFNMFK